MYATVEINDAVFCVEHLAEICEDCSTDLREENDSFYGFDPTDREAIEVPPVSRDDDACSQCFGWKKKINKARSDAKRADKH
ncbi:hypothetical protein IL306_015028 [Fusarium sp. DS 682]|nr:hypothetical protein IL306_015028 [Fusarium sp. DS 682]